MKRLALVALLAALLPSGASATATKFNPDPVYPVGPISETTSHQIAKLTRVASALAGRHATVNCWSKDDWSRLQAWNGAHHDVRAIDASGITWFRTHHIELDPFLCEVLQQTLAKSADQPLFEAFAVTVFAHESAHASGIQNESLAECRALETEPRAAGLLGLSKRAAARFRHIYRGSVYPYEPSRYRSRSCHAGLPGVLVPDTLGSTAALGPLRRTATAVVRALPGWKNTEGGGAVGPLSPCSVFSDRRLEVARYGIGLTGPSGYSALVQRAQTRTRHDYAGLLVRGRAEPRCDLADQRTYIREKHSAASVVLARLPRAITGLSPEVHGFRESWTLHSQHWDDDVIHIFDRASLTSTALDFRVPAGKAALAVEVRAVKAALRTIH